MQILQITVFIFFIWLVGLTFLAFYIFRHFRRLSKVVGTGNLITVIEKLIDLEEDKSRVLEFVQKRIDKIEDDSLVHLQKVGFIRFNPFEELGGDHSFSLTILDANNNGFVVTGLHSRDRTRLYSKEIRNGKSDTNLSKEEKRALDKALKQ